jgi:hypothetical protein
MPAMTRGSNQKPPCSDKVASWDGDMDPADNPLLTDLYQLDLIQAPRVDRHRSISQRRGAA